MDARTTCGRPRSPMKMNEPSITMTFVRLPFFEITEFRDFNYSLDHTTPQSEIFIITFLRYRPCRR